ncbi:MAG: VanZ family protein [Eubacteriales bacterium]|nr:VanZ family protein [Eubacteriales bacterium]
MSAYIEPILTALWIFPFVAVVFTLPYMMFQYRHYGSILMLRTVIVYSFILYCMCAYFLTMLPLPTIESVAQLTTPTCQLVPFFDWAMWIRHSHVVLGDPSTWKGLLNSDLFQLVANIALTLPLGMYLRYYFGCSLKKTVLLSFCASLLFELTQLSGLFFIYPRPYRLFEVDDLMTNTFGGLVGYWAVGPLMRFLPTQARMNEVAYRRSNHVSVTRRLTAAVTDWFLIGCFAIVLVCVLPSFRKAMFFGDVWSTLTAMAFYYVPMVLLYFIIGEWLQRGLTVGKRIMRLQLVDDRDDSRPKLWQTFVRYSILYYGFLPIPAFILVLALKFGDADPTSRLYLALGAIALMALYLVFLILIIIRVLTHSNQLPHGEWSKTRNISTLPIDLELIDKVGFQPDSIDEQPEDDKDDSELLNG